MIITAHELKKQLHEVQQQSRYIVGTNTSPQAATDEAGGVLLSVENIIKVNGSNVITDKGTKAPLFMAAPGLYWKCLGTPATNGDITLKKKLEGLFIDDGSKKYCIGVNGATDEFEVRFHIGKNEIRVNNSFINIMANHLITNGTEVEK